jgi:DnaJ-class molecular chaperone
MKSHPDKGGNPAIFAEMTEAYDVLCSEQRKDYDMKSKFGNNYNEYYEFFDINIDVDYQTEKDRLERFKKNEMLDIYIDAPDDFNGTVEYERLVRCKTCDGNIVKVFDGEDGCDFCEGSGKYMDCDCTFCDGKGKVGLNPCGVCKGEKRILGKQKLSKIKLTGEVTKVEAMGNTSKLEVGKVGHLIIRNKVR